MYAVIEVSDNNNPYFIISENLGLVVIFETIEEAIHEVDDCQEAVIFDCNMGQTLSQKEIKQLIQIESKPNLI